MPTSVAWGESSSHLTVLTCHQDFFYSLSQRHGTYTHRQSTCLILALSESDCDEELCYTWHEVVLTGLQRQHTPKS